MEITNCRIVKAYGHTYCNNCHKLVEYEIPYDIKRTETYVVVCPNCENNAREFDFDTLYNKHVKTYENNPFGIVFKEI